MSIFITHQISYFHTFLTLCSFFSLTQVVSSYTHVCPTGNTSLIDLALISNTSKVSQCQTISPLCNSDHLGVELDIKVKNISMCQKSGTRTVYGYMIMLISEKPII